MKGRQMLINVRLRWFLLITLIMLLWFNWPAGRLIHALQATPTPRPSPAPTRSPGWAGSASSVIPVGLQGTARISPTGAISAIPEDLCGAVLSRRQDIWVLSAREVFLRDGPATPIMDAFLVNGRMVEVASHRQLFYIQSCSPIENRDTTISLIAPTGDHLPFMRDEQAGVDTRTSLIFYTYTFTLDDPAGDYTILLESAGSVIQQTVSLHHLNFLVDLYNGPRFRLYEQASGQERQQFAAGETMHIEYDRYPAEQEIEVGLYQPQGLQYILANTWTFRSDSEGRHQETLTIPPDATPGSYTLVAGALEASPFGEFAFGQFAPNNFTTGEQRSYYYLTFNVTAPAAETPAMGPVEVARAFYQAINEGVATGDFHPAYNLLSRARRAARPYASFAQGFATTREVQVEQLELLEQNNDNATIQVVLLAIDLVDGARQAVRYSIIYHLVKEGAQWRLDRASVTQL
jgi:hypothetical protein